jgi:hypothetical protein
LNNNKDYENIDDLFNEPIDAIMDEAKPGRKAGNDVIDKIIEIAKFARKQAKFNLSYHKPLIDYIIKSNNKDNMYIERTLDSLTDLMYMGEGVKEFNRLIDYYKNIDFDGARSYHIHALSNGFLSRFNYESDLYLFKYPRSEYAIFGSGPLAIRGIRNNKDIDIIVKDSLWKILSNDVCNSDNIIRINHLKIYNNINDYFNNKNLIIDDSEKITDFNYVKLDYIFQMKLNSDRKKDKKDLVLIKEYMEKWKK